MGKKTKYEGKEVGGSFNPFGKEKENKVGDFGWKLFGKKKYKETPSPFQVAMKKKRVRV